MALPTFTMRQLLEAGVHFGHRAGRWNPKMAPYLYGVRNKVHIIDLQQTVPMLHKALVSIRDIVASGGRVLFVGTKRQASESITTAATRCGQYYVNHRWLGGMMTNWQTISRSIKRLRTVEEQLASEEATGLTKKELLKLTRERDKLDRALGGIKDIGGLPDIIFVIDTNKEEIAVKEAQKLGIPIVAVVDSNSDPDGITHPIPGNDDALRAINLYCDLVSAAVLDGIQHELVAAGADVGEAEELPTEDLGKADEAAAAAADKAPAEAQEPAPDAPAAAAEAEPSPAESGEAPAPAEGDDKAATGGAGESTEAGAVAAPEEAAGKEAAGSVEAEAPAAPESEAAAPAAEARSEGTAEEVPAAEAMPATEEAAAAASEDKDEPKPEGS